MQTYQKLQTKMQDKTWIDTLAVTLPEEDIKLLQDTEIMAGNLISQVYIFIDLFHQYIDLVQSAAIFSPDFVEPTENDAKVYPTQTSAPEQAIGGNRAERRSAEKQKYGKPKIRKTPFEAVKK